jgi:hypothetical protein
MTIHPASSISLASSAFSADTPADAVLKAFGTSSWGWSQLGAELRNEIAGKISGSQDSASQLQDLLKGWIATKDTSHLTADDISHLYQAFGLTPPEPGPTPSSKADFDKIVDAMNASTESWTKPGADFRTFINHAIDSLRGNGTVAELQGELAKLTAGDLLSEYPGITQNDVDNVFHAAGVSPIPQISGHAPPTPGSGQFGPSTPLLPGSVPLSLNNTSGSADQDTYVVITGINPDTNQTCYIQFDATGHPIYIPITGAGQTSDAYAYNLAQLPKDANGKPELNLPPPDLWENLSLSRSSGTFELCP